MSKEIKITFPQITFDTKVVEVSEEEFEDLMNGCDEEKTTFIWDNLTDQEKDWTQGKKWIEDAVDVGYAGLTKRDKDN